MVLLDTHVLIWWVSSPEKLSNKAIEAINKAKSGEILVSSISIWELFMLVKKGRLELNMDTQSWLDKVVVVCEIQFVPVDNQIAAKSVNLPGEFHDDPADRIIVASARENGAVLITKDERIIKYPHVRSLW